MAVSCGHGVRAWWLCSELEHRIAGRMAVGWHVAAFCHTTGPQGWSSSDRALEPCRGQAGRLAVKLSAA